MIIYLASTAPGNEINNLQVKKRLLSFYHISKKTLENHYVFNLIKNENKRKRTQNSIGNRETRFI
jgi:hypothetical protein